ncbi:MAG: glycosyltransferase family 4 protein [Thermoleophilaceae bacterium]
MDRRVAMGLLFYPRGGSAQVALYLAIALGGTGWTTELLCGSLGPTGQRTHAATFFEGLSVRAADYDPALAAFEQGEDPIAQPFPLHPSYEDRPGAADRIFTAVSPELQEHLADAWARFMDDRLDPFDVAHLHHLTPLHEAMARVRPGVPVVTHLHGTELKMIDRAERELASGAEGPSWRHAGPWLKAMRRWARASDRLLVISPHDRDEAQRLLGVDPERVTWIPNGVDIDRFAPRSLTAPERMQRWRRWLVEAPQGWREGAAPGTVAYTDADLESFVDPDTGEAAPVLLFVGRFTEVKRIPLLVRAYARARERFNRPAPLVIWGGFPGEWEGEHPHTVAEAEGARDVFFLGGRGHAELPEGLACSDVMVMPSTNESFGQVFVEAMACGVAVIAANAGGPPSFVNVDPARPNGWLVEPDDLDSLAGAMVAAVNDPGEREWRAFNGLEVTRRDFSWTSLAHQTAAVYEQAIGSRQD